jgi:hypothetical protein
MVKISDAGVRKALAVSMFGAKTASDSDDDVDQEQSKIQNQKSK